MTTSDIHSPLAGQIVDAIRSVAGDGPVGLHEPTFEGNEWAYLKECLDTTFVSSIGKFVDRFEVDLARFMGANHAIAVVNGTAALQVAMQLAGVRRDDEVLTPALTFVASANAVHHCGAHPHFVDSASENLGIDTEKLRAYLSAHTTQENQQCVNRATDRVIRAIVPMHVFGHPSDIDGLLAIAHDFNLVMVEDAAESLGSYYHGQHTGTFGTLSAVSFNGNKTITTGGGGAIITNDPELAKQAKHLTTTAKLPHKWAFRHDEAGYNYRMPNINAALGCAQLEQLPDKLAAKRALYTRYSKAFDKISEVELVHEPASCQSNYWLQALILTDAAVNQRNMILQVTNDAGLMTRPVWELMHTLDPYKDCPRMDLSSAVSLAQRLINIPSSPSLIK